MTMTEQEMRDGFEHNFGNLPRNNFLRNQSGCYKLDEIQDFWNVWKRAMYYAAERERGFEKLFIDADNDRTKFLKQLKRQAEKYTEIDAVFAELDKQPWEFPTKEFLFAKLREILERKP